MKQIQIPSENYSFDITLIEKSLDNLSKYIYCSSECENLKENKKDGIAFFQEDFIATTEGKIYNIIMNCLSRLKINENEYDNNIFFNKFYHYITVINNIVIFTFNDIKLSNPILLDEKETQELESACVQRFLNSRKRMFHWINKIKNLTNSPRLLILLYKIFSKVSMTLELLKIFKLKKEKYIYIVTKKEKDIYRKKSKISDIAYFLINPALKNLKKTSNNTNNTNAFNIIYLNNCSISEDLILKTSNKLKAIPCNKLLNIEDFFTVNFNNLQSIFNLAEVNEIFLLNNQFIIYSSIIKSNYEKLALKLSKYNILI